MNTDSPLRYPGGKGAMSDLLQQVIRLNRLGDHALAEPFAGGAGASLRLLYQEETPRICINDLDRAISAFWWCLVHSNRQFIEKLETTRVNMAEWRRQRDIYRSTGRVSKLSRGFSAFFLNRCNRSGIVVNGGPIGGLRQQGQWKLGARFNRRDLKQRCERVRLYADRISVSADDALDFITATQNDRTFYFIDPPYFEKGRSLYLNAVDADYHAALAKRLRAMRDVPWVLTYDDCPEVRALYKGWSAVRSFSLRYVASERRAGKEVMITPKWLRLPRDQRSLAIRW